MLIGRSAELEYLTKYYEQDENSLIVLYGQKGLGVTSLLRAFTKGKSALTLCATPCSERQQAYVWSRHLKNQGISLPEYPDFSVIFHSVLANTEGKQIIVIEDFQWQIRNGQRFADALFAFYHKPENKGRVMLILASSALGWVENSFVSKIGRNAFAISGFLKLKPMSFLDMICFFDTADTGKCMEIYSITGGNPSYWKHFDLSKSLKENICELFLEKDGKFAEIGLDRMEDELREPGIYSTVLATLAEGREKLNDIYMHTEFSRAKISVYLKNLMSLELVEKVFSYETADNRNSKKGVYRISDTMVNFWYHFIFPNVDSMAELSAEAFYDELIAPCIQEWVRGAYGKISSEYLEILNEQEKLPVKFIRSGEWVGKNGKIDFVGQDIKRNTILGLCNRSTLPFEVTDYEHLKELAKEAHLRPEHVFLFSATGFSKELQGLVEEKQNIYLIDMNDL